MAKGRKPKPTALKVLGGNAGKRPLNNTEPKPPKKNKISCPKEFEIERFRPAFAGEQDKEFRTTPAAKHAAKELKRLSKLLDPMGVLTAVDVGMLEAYCQAYGLWREATAYVNRYGAVLFSKDGGMYQNPYLAVVNKQAAIMAKIGSEFGLTPSSRSGLQIPDAAKNQDPLQELLNRRRERKQQQGG